MNKISRSANTSLNRYPVHYKTSKTDDSHVEYMAKISEVDSSDWALRLQSKSIKERGSIVEQTSAKRFAELNRISLSQQYKNDDENICSNVCPLKKNALLSSPINQNIHNLPNLKYDKNSTQSNLRNKEENQNNLNIRLNTSTIQNQSLSKKIEILSFRSMDDTSPKQIPLHIIDPHLFELQDTISFGSGTAHRNFMCIFAIWNSMVGSGMFILPYAFYTCGILYSSLTILVVSLVLMYTALLIVSNCKYAADFNDIIYKYGGHTPRYLYSLASFTLLFFVSYVYAIYLNQGIYSIINMVVDLPAIDQLDMGTYNVFYGSLLVFAIVSIFIFQSDRRLIVTLSSLGAFVIILILIWLTWSCIVNFDNIGEVELVRPYNAVQPNEFFLVGPMIAGFVVHPLIMPIIRSNNCFDSMKSNTIIGFALVALTYFGCGLFGFFGYYYSYNEIGNQNPNYNLKDAPQNVLLMVSPTFSKDVFGNVIKILCVFQYMTLIPLYIFVTRDLFFNTFALNQKYFYVYNVVYIVIGVLLLTFYSNIGVIMNYLGLLSGLVITVLVPIGIWVCKYFRAEEHWHSINIKIYYEQFKGDELYQKMLEANDKNEQDYRFVQGHGNIKDKCRLYCKLSINILIMLAFTAMSAYCFYLVV